MDACLVDKLGATDEQRTWHKDCPYCQKSVQFTSDAVIVRHYLRWHGISRERLHLIADRIVELHDVIGSGAMMREDAAWLRSLAERMKGGK